MEKADILALEQEIFNVKEDTFEKVALEVFKFQYANCGIYRQFCDLLNRPFPKTIKEIPFLPVTFFKSEKILSEGYHISKTFKSSGTTGSIRSNHHVVKLELYEKSFHLTFEQAIGKPSRQVIIALLPSYLEQGESSLLYMVDKLIEKSQNTYSGYFLDNVEQLPDYIKKIKKNAPDKQVVIIGVSYALLDLAAFKPDLSNVIVIETGGMKGRRKEMTKEDLHETLERAFNIPVISSEYGMTELLSQAYSVKNQKFIAPPWMKVMIRDINDAFSYLENRKTGGINVIDLANLYSCSFISTQDLGKIHENGFKILGRFDNSDIRGCNLLVN
ncbi:MAG: acyl transferase [Lishizhenia sp.]